METQSTGTPEHLGLDSNLPGGHPETRRAALATFLEDLWAQHLGKSVPFPVPRPGPGPAAARSKANSRRGRGGQALLAKAQNSRSRTGAYLCRSQEDEGPLPPAARRPPALGQAGTLRRNLTGSSLGPDVTQHLSLFPWPGRLVSWVQKHSGFSQ